MVPLDAKTLYASPYPGSPKVQQTYESSYWRSYLGSLVRTYNAEIMPCTNVLRFGIVLLEMLITGVFCQEALESKTACGIEQASCSTAQYCSFHETHP